MQCLNCNKLLSQIVAEDCAIELNRGLFHLSLAEFIESKQVEDRNTIDFSLFEHTPPTLYMIRNNANLTSKNHNIDHAYSLESNPSLVAPENTVSLQLSCGPQAQQIVWNAKYRVHNNSNNLASQLTNLDMNGPFDSIWFQYFKPNFLALDEQNTHAVIVNYKLSETNTFAYIRIYTDHDAIRM